MSEHKRKEAAKVNKKDVGEKSFTHELTLGLPSIAVNSIILFAGIFVLSLLYKAGATLLSGAGSQLAVENFFLSVGSEYIVNPVAAFFATILLFVLKNIYDIRFYLLLQDAKKSHKKGVRIIAVILYILIMVWFMILTFIWFRCGRSFWDYYYFTDSFLANFCDTILFVLCPLCYVIQAIVRYIMRKRKSTK
ncbi:MAG: hypothetical protein KBS85_05765 [Lachnospiraceae bacterium]|nr:hypothetical protein [Candidatus Merdinaster equi]